MVGSPVGSSDKRQKGRLKRASACRRSGGKFQTTFF
nr:MAG TPA: hypothetical protein [Caudoviricetes sp.]DAY31625.1 MAG TPA: hypothetical protein [Caudoviricetes sp.]